MIRLRIMGVRRWVGIWFAAGMVAACSSSETPATSTPTTSAGGAGGSSGVTTSSSAGGAGGEVPLMCFAQYTTVPKGECDLLKQDCPLGSTCAPMPSDGDYVSMCKPSAGLKSAGETCYSEAECKAKLFCVAGKCAAVCCRDDNRPCNGGICDITVPFGIRKVYFCHYAPKCDLLTPNACPLGLGCHIEDKDQGLATCVAPSGTPAPDLGPCLYLNDCDDMEQCYATGTSGTSTCHYYCFLSGSSAAPGLGGCPDGQTCQSSYQGKAIDFGVPNVGLCF